MAEYIPKSALVAEMNKLKNISLEYGYTTEQRIVADVGKDLTLKGLLDYTDALEVKDIPSWKRATEDILIGCLVWDEQRHFHLYSDRVAKGELYISIADILRLPGSPRKE